MEFITCRFDLSQFMITKYYENRTIMVSKCLDLEVFGVLG